MMLKKRITKHEARSPSPKAAGPSVPAENLANTSPITLPTQERTDGREDVEVHGEPDEEYLAVLCIRPTLWRNGENAWGNRRLSTRTHDCQKRRADLSLRRRTSSLLASIALQLERAQRHQFLLENLIFLQALSIHGSELRPLQENRWREARVGISRSENLTFRWRVGET